MTIIGITAGFHSSQENFFSLHQSYLKVLHRVGVTPIILTAGIDSTGLKKLINKVDGIILSGGGDINPLLLKQPPHHKLKTIDPLRDQFEINLTNLALRNKIPILAICRGMQLLNFCCGGSLIQDLTDSHNHSQQAPPQYPIHQVYIAPNTHLYQIFKQTVLSVNSFHHQAVATAGKQVIFSAVAMDGVIEALEIKDHPFALGLQWHPEKMWQHQFQQLKVFQHFAVVCERRK